MTLARRILRQFGILALCQAGTTLVELAVVIPLFLLILFGLIDFGRMGFEYVMAEKAMQLATRIAVVRPAACPGVPQVNGRVTGTTYYFGTACNSAANVCSNPGTVTCVGSSGNATAAEIWTAIQPLMPSNSTIGNLSFSYAQNTDFGFLGGPYTPMVTVKITGLNFTFVSPLGALVTLAGATNTLPSQYTFPSLAVSLPAEDLNNGEAG